VSVNLRKSAVGFGGCRLKRENTPMKSKNEPEATQKTKKELVLGDSPRKMNPFLLTITIAFIVAAAGAAYFVWTAPASAPSYAQTNTAPPAYTGNQTVDYPLSLFSDGQARHFDYAFNGLVIRYFILQSSDGIVRAAFDACDVCWQSGKGYTQNGDDMVCINCNRRFASNRINEVQGGCNPAPLDRTIEGDRIVIRVSDIVQGQMYFNFKGRS
jgi:uncharacterized membrane protein